MENVLPLFFKDISPEISSTKQAEEFYIRSGITIPETVK